MGGTRFDREVDVLVVGSGAGGMTAALTAEAADLNAMVIEKSALFGGSTARSGGGAWVPNAPPLLRAGEADDPAEILAYLERLAGDRVAKERLERYVEAAPAAVSFLEAASPHLDGGFTWFPGYPDYHPDRGGNPLGRGIWATPIDRRELGAEIDLLQPGLKRMRLPLGAWLTSQDLPDLLALRWGGLRHKRILLLLAWRVLRARLLGERIAVSGQALAIRLRLALRDRGIPLRLSTPMRSLLRDGDGRVVGVEAERDGRPYRIGAGATILASGGFDHDPELRRRHQGVLPREWSLGSPDNIGDGHRAGLEAGAAVDLMEDAWWIPVAEMPDGALFMLVAERQYPGQFIVNAAGRRFVNEAAPYGDFVHSQLEGEESGVAHVPAWMVFDERAWKRNLIAGHPPGAPTPRGWKASGNFKSAPTIELLAVEIGVPATALRETADRFNRFAEAGEDEDFRRGENAYDRYYGDRSLPNPNLAPVAEPPFYALAVYPGDLGTKGGLLVDEEARVLREDGSAIPGLYATGNVSAAVMGTDYAGAGATLGSAIAFGYVAARHAAALHGK